jgi:hypothetical protein
MLVGQPASLGALVAIEHGFRRNQCGAILFAPMLAHIRFPHAPIVGWESQQKEDRPEVYTKSYTSNIAGVLCRNQKGVHFPAHSTLEQAECQNLKRRNPRSRECGECRNGLLLRIIFDLPRCPGL